MAMKTLLLTLVALIAFAANTILCRMALGTNSIDPASFTSVRLLSGALVLWLLLRLNRSPKPHQGNWQGAAFLFIYAISFSFAYVSLTTGTGALILFGWVQVTMISVGLLSGYRPTLLAWLGLLLASAGLVYLMLPGISAPDPTGALLMSIAGIAWGAYSLKGQRVTSPLAATTGNFIYTIPMALVTSLLFMTQQHSSVKGIILAMLSGSLASGVGYAIWYRTLPLLTSTSAASAQLAVPVIAAFGGVLFMGEAFTQRLLFASLLILGGIALVISQKKMNR